MVVLECKRGRGQGVAEDDAARDEEDEALLEDVGSVVGINGDRRGGRR